MRWRLNDFIMIGLVLIFTFIVAPMSCDARDVSYVDEGGYKVPCPLGYTLVSELNNLNLSNAQDIFIDSSDHIYIADTGNNRIVQVSTDGRLIKSYGGEDTLARPEGVFVNKNGDVYVADTGNARVVIFNNEGKIIKIIGKPNSVLLKKEYKYWPSKIIVDKANNIFVINRDDFRGIIWLDSGGNFRGFFGSNKLPESLTRRLVKLFASKEQKEFLAKDYPSPHSNAFIDENGFIYTVSKYAQNKQIRKLTMVGADVYDPYKRFYGEKVIEGLDIVFPSFVDITVNSYDIVCALDAKSGKIYEYDQDGHFLTVFGGLGDFKGMFKKPTSIAQDSAGHYYVLDAELNSVQIFSPTYFSTIVHKASNYYNEGRYKEAVRIWKEVSFLNSNYSFAYKGIAKAYWREGNYVAALKNYKKAYDSKNFSNVFKDQRNLILRKYFGRIIGIITLSVIILFALSRGVRYILKIPDEAAGWLVITFKDAWRVMFNPTEGFDIVKRRRNINGTILIMVLAFICRLVNVGFTSFQLSKINPDYINIASQVGFVFIPWLLWSVVMYGITCVREGKSDLVDNMICTAFSITPWVIISIPLTLLTHILSKSESGLIHFINYSIWVWCAILLLYQVKGINEYTIKKAAAMMLVTVLGMFAVAIVGSLCYGMLDQMTLFFRQIATEIRY